MKIRTMEILLIIQLVVIVLIIKFIIPAGNVKNKTELLREISPDGNYVLVIEEQGKPFFPLSGLYQSEALRKQRRH